MLILTKTQSNSLHETTGMDASNVNGPNAKAVFLLRDSIKIVKQESQLKNPDARITLQELNQEELLSTYARSLVGIQTGDNSYYMCYFWEQRTSNDETWNPCITPSTDVYPYSGRSRILRWCSGNGRLQKDPQARIQGLDAVGKKGVFITRVSSIRAYLYLGELYDQNPAVILPYNPIHLPAIWAYCQSPAYVKALRQIDKKINVTNSTLVKVPFDLDYWQEVADETGPLPEPYSNDPTQWLFQGDPVDSTAQLQVAVARLLDYHWPQQDFPDEMDHLADKDGIVCLSPLAGEPPAHERLRQVLAAAYAHFWMTSVHDKLLQDVGYGHNTLEEWLRDGFFEQHCKLFQNRPFIWHIWDGRKDGFAALVNYHKLDANRLNNLIYTYLGDWIRLQRAAQDAGVAGADGRLVAALELQKKLIAIQHGEPPYDIYVRWKPLHEQPIGWHPDLNDGVRLNIRPFVEAGILRRKFNINWSKDRGQNPDGTERLNDLHYTRAEKEAARRAKGQNTQ